MPGWDWSSVEDVSDGCLTTELSIYIDEVVIPRMVVKVIGTLASALGGGPPPWGVRGIPPLTASHIEGDPEVPQVDYVLGGGTYPE